MITRVQYNVIQTYRTTCEDSGGLLNRPPISPPNADVLVRMVLADRFKDGFPDWFPVTDLEGKPSDLDAVQDATAQLPTNPTSGPVSISVVNDFKHSFHEPSLFDPETAND